MFCHLDYLSQLRDEVLKIVEKLYNEKNALLNKNEKKKNPNWFYWSKIQDIYSISSHIFFLL